MSSEAMPSAPVMPSSTSGFGRSTAIPNSLRRDLPLVSASWSGDRLPPRMSWPGTSVHGTVSERVDGALRPVAGATVTLDSGIPDPPATTTASGFYMICSEVGTDKYRTITALKAGYRNNRPADLRGGIPGSISNSNATELLREALESGRYFS